MILKSYFSKKKNLLLFTIFFAVAIMFIMIIMAYKLHIKLNLNTEISNKAENRALIVGKDKCEKYDCIEENLSTDKINSIYEYTFDFYGNNLELGSVLFKEGILEFIPDVIEGIQLNENSKNSVIIPKYIKINNEIVETSSYLNHNINFLINRYGEEIEYSPKIIGIYNNEDNIEDNIIIYYSYKDVTLFETDKISPQIIVILKDETFISDFIDYLASNNYYYNYYDDTKLKELNYYNNLYKLISLYEILIISIIIGVIILFMLTIINNQKYNIALKKAVGYTNKIIIKTLIKELSYYFTIIYLFLILINYIVINILDKDILFVISIYYILLYLFIIIQIFIANIITFSKIKKIQIIDLLKETR